MRAGPVIGATAKPADRITKSLKGSQTYIMEWRDLPRMGL